MSKAPKLSKAATRVYVAGCQRTWALTSREADLAYTALAFAECPTCPHRVEPEIAGAQSSVSFCTLRPQGQPHPFAALAGLRLTE